jgi:hypothetical protein
LQGVVAFICCSHICAAAECCRGEVEGVSYPSTGCYCCCCVIYRAILIYYRGKKHSQIPYFALPPRMLSITRKRQYHTVYRSVAQEGQSGRRRMNCSDFHTDSAYTDSRLITTINRKNSSFPNRTFNSFRHVTCLMYQFPDKPQLLTLVRF